MEYLFWMLFICLNILNPVICDDELKLVSRLPKNPLMKYTSYSNVMILHFKVPVDTTKAVFLFKVKDSPTSVFVRNCDTRNVSIFLRPGSYPVINPDGVAFPKTFLNESRPELYNITLLSDLKPVYINISAPDPGHWFAAAFVSWTDPKNDKIEQQGLSSECEANLHAEFYIIQKQITTLPTLEKTHIKLQEERQIYKFFVPENIDHIFIYFKVENPCIYCEYIVISVQENKIPNENSYLETLRLNGTSDYFIRFWPLENRWHYIDFHYDSINITIDNITDIEVTLKYISGLTKADENNTDILYFKKAIKKQMTSKYKSLHNILPYKEYNMMRISSADNFIFEYDLPPYKNESSPMFLNVTNTEMTVLKFDIYEIIDIGGTLSFGFAIKPNMSKNKTESANVTIIACVSRDVIEVPTFPDQCVYRNMNWSAPVTLNSSIAGSLNILHVPFPDAGTWYISFKAFYEDCSACKCSNVCEKTYDICLLDCENTCDVTIDSCDSCIDKCKTKAMISEECKACNCDGNCLRKKEDLPINISLVFSISSQPCIGGRCGKYGKCNHYIAGGFIFSSCHCFGGYRGWDCSDGSQSRSSGEILLSILLLTLSNLLFIISVFIAYKRSYYTEAVVYFFTMFFSTFYHACDSEESIYGFCLFKLGVLQFCDFYCGLMSIWVTLVAMSHFGTRISSISHICGAILLAFGTIYNKQALWVFLMPALSGLVLIGVSWGLRCYQTRKLFPARNYLVKFMPVGLFLVLMGLVSFAFLQTKDNYKFVHSLWHVIMAVSVIFLLPTSTNFIPKI